MKKEFKNEHLLTAKEKEYWSIVKAQYLVLNLKGRPMTAKSALAQSIADKLGLILVDLRIPTMEEVDLGVYPKATDELDTIHKKIAIEKQLYGAVKEETRKLYETIVTEKRTTECLSHPVPEWAYQTLDKTKNFLIVFEEFNRAPLAVRNAAMGVMLERRVGFNFTFGDNVYMMATGNIGGDADGTDVEELDSAQKSRFITKQHEMEYVEWRDWAVLEKAGITNIHPKIVQFLDSKISKYYPEMKDQGGKEYSDTICGPRTWTALSRYIQVNYGDSEIDIRDIARQAPSFIGPVAAEFVQFLTDTKRLYLKDILAGTVKNYKGIYRENRMEVINELKEFDIFKAKDKEIDHITEFLRTTDEDVVSGYLFDWMGTLDAEDNKVVKNKNFLRIVREFRPLINEKAIKANTEDTKEKK